MTIYHCSTLPAHTLRTIPTTDASRGQPTFCAGCPLWPCGAAYATSFQCVANLREEARRQREAAAMLAAICADCTKIDPDSHISSTGKPRSECWAEWALEKATEDNREKHI
jgi:hypothetical protein